MGCKSSWPKTRIGPGSWRQNFMLICLGRGQRLNMRGMLRAAWGACLDPSCVPERPPSIGKSVWARPLTAPLEIPYADVDAIKGGAGMALIVVDEVPEILPQTHFCHFWSLRRQRRGTARADTGIGSSIGQQVGVID